MKWRALIFLFIIIIIIGFSLFNFNQKDQVSDSESKSLITPLLTNPIPKSFQNESASMKSLKSQVPTEALPILDWVKSTANKMDTDSFDTASEEAKLKEKAMRLSNEEILELKKTVLSRESSANERILSTFLLSLSSSQSIKAIQEIATSELSIQNIPEPHSLDETQSMHEKALRRMMIDELFRRAIADPSYRGQLSHEIEKISVPELKAYAQNRFKQLFE